MGDGNENFILAAPFLPLHGGVSADDVKNFREKIPFMQPENIELRHKNRNMIATCDFLSPDRTKLSPLVNQKIFSSPLPPFSLPFTGRGWDA